ncbi:MAG: mechanosensitive ion channel family protein, partial [Myxococcota bacterium]
MIEQIQGYFAEGLGSFLAYLPNLVAGIVILVLGYFISRLLGAAMRKLLSKARFDEIMARRVHPKASQPNRMASRTTGRAVFWL